LVAGPESDWTVVIATRLSAFFNIDTGAVIQPGRSRQTALFREVDFSGDRQSPRAINGSLASEMREVRCLPAASAPARGKQE
jgi:hypothetical protein